MPRYKTIADSEDFGLLMVACNKSVCICDANKLTGIDEIVKVSSLVHRIGGATLIVQS